MIGTNPKNRLEEAVLGSYGIEAEKNLAIRLRYDSIFYLSKVVTACKKKLVNMRNIIETYNDQNYRNNSGKDIDDYMKDKDIKNVIGYRAFKSNNDFINLSLGKINVLIFSSNNIVKFSIPSYCNILPSNNSNIELTALNSTIFPSIIIASQIFRKVS